MAATEKKKPGRKPKETVTKAYHNDCIAQKNAEIDNLTAALHKAQHASTDSQSDVLHGLAMIVRQIEMMEYQTRLLINKLQA